MKTGSNPNTDDPGWLQGGSPFWRYSMASTLVQAARVSGKTGKVIWKDKRLVRKNLKPADADFSKALTPLCRDFDIN